MNVLVDLLFFVPGKNGGIEVFIDRLLPQLRSLPDTHVICLTNKLNHSYCRDEKRFQCYASPLDGGNRLTRLMYQQCMVGSIGKKVNADVIFCPGNLSPIFSALPTVAVIHDLNFLDIPGSMHWGVRFVYNMLIPRVVRASSKIVTGSQFSKTRILQKLDGASGKIAVVYQGPLAGDIVASDWQSVKRKFAVRDNCFLSISSGLPHKNVGRLVRGFVAMKKKLPGDHQLVLVGHTLDFDIETYLRKEAVQDDVVATGFVSEAEKLSFLKNSLAYIFPSLYEGFGLPALEAQFCGLPLATSTFGSLPEVCGEGAVYFDATSIESIEKTLTLLSQNQVLRERLIRKGYENLRRFSWRRTAIELRQILKGAAETGEAVHL